MKDRVVCIENHHQDPNLPKTIVGEIYTVFCLQNDGFYILNEMPENIAYKACNFREVDTTYGPAICETIEQQIELEKVLAKEPNEIDMIFRKLLKDGWG